MVDELDREQLWAKKIESNKFMICCIPFFIYDLSLGDIVETDESYLVKSVFSRSGRFVFRVWLLSEDSAERIAVAENLTKMGALLEQSSANLFAVDASSEKLAAEVSGFMLELEGKGIIQYETGNTYSNLSCTIPAYVEFIGT